MGKIKDLRKAGQLKEAWLEAAAEFRQRPDDIWVAREFSWVVYDCMKRYTDRSSKYFGDMDAYVKCLAKARTLPLGPDEAMFFENAGKNIRFVIWELAKKKDNIGVPALRMLLDEITKWPNDAQLFIPGIIRGLSKGLGSDPHSIVKLFDWYGLDKFEPQDFEKKEVNGRKVLSDAESMTHAYLKALQNKDQTGNLEFDEQTLLKGASAAKCLLADSRCEEWQWPLYSLGELLVVMGRHEEAMSFLAPVVVEKSRESWIWHAFGKSIKPKSEESYVKCLFMGLFVSRETKMSLSLHEEALSYFASNGMLSQAKAEALLIDSCRRENGWSLSELASRVLRDPNYDGVLEESDLKSVYASKSEGAVDCLSSFVPKTDFYLERGDKNKGMLGIAILKTVQPSYLCRSVSLSLERKKVYYSGAQDVLPIGETCSAIFDKRQKHIIGGVEINKEAKIRPLVLREGFGILDFFENTETGKKSYFIRVPVSCERDDDSFVPLVIAEKDSISSGNLVFFRERLVFRRVQNSQEGKKNGEGEWKWETLSIEDKGIPSEENLTDVPSVEFYVEWVNKDRNIASIVVATMEQKSFYGGAYADHGSGLKRKRVSSKFVKVPIEERSVYQGRIFGKVREILSGPIKKVDSGLLHDKVIRKGIEGLYEVSNGWGNVGCKEDISIPPKQAEKYAIVSGSRVRVDAHLAYLKNWNKQEINDSSGDGRWVWRISAIEVVALPEEKLISGEIRIMNAGFGLIDLNYDEDGTCFVSQDLVRAYGLLEGDTIEVKMRRSWDRKKKVESWAAIDLVQAIRAGFELINPEDEISNCDELIEGN